MALLSTDPVDFKLDANGDLILTDDLELVSGKDGIAQLAKIAFQMAKDEWVLNLDEGLPLLAGEGVTESESLFSEFDEDKWRAAFREVALSIDGVVNLVSLDFALDSETREVEASVILNTVFGEITVEV